MPGSAVPRIRPELGPGRWGRRELREVAKAERFFDRGDVLDRLVEPVFAELPMLDVFEGLAQLAQLFLGERLSPGRENDRILARCMVPVHRVESFEGAGERLDIADRVLVGDVADILGDIAA